jgi:hypothetical protein
MMGSNLTTDQRPFVDVTGLHCSMKAQQAQMVDENQDWAAFGLDFQVPETCQAVQIRVRRKPSRNIDNLIQGDFWLKSVALQKIEEPQAMHIAPLTVAPALMPQPSGGRP